MISSAIQKTRNFCSRIVPKGIPFTRQKHRKSHCLETYQSQIGYELSEMAFLPHHTQRIGDVAFDGTEALEDFGKTTTRPTSL